MDGIVPLKDDHKNVKRLFREFEKTHKTVGVAEKHALGRKRLTELGEQMLAAKPKAPADPLALRSARS